MPISSLMQRFIEDELSRSRVLVERMMASVANGVTSADKVAATPQGDGSRRVERDALESLQKGRNLFAQTFIEVLQTRVTADLQGLDQAIPSGFDVGIDIGGLALMDETLVEADIEISRATQLIDGAAEWELRELQTFTSALIGQSHVTADSNPLRPAAYAQALWSATCAVNAVPIQRSVLLRLTAKGLASLLKMAWAAACTRLESQGVEPSVYRTMVLPGAAPPSPAPAASPVPTHGVTLPRGFEQLLNRLSGSSGDAGLITLRELASPLAAPQPSRGSAPASRAAFTPAFEQALRHIESLVHDQRGDAVESIAPGSASRLRSHSAKLVAEMPGGLDRQIVELISRVFDAVLSDEQVAPAVRNVLARLQVSALRIALVDPGMLESHQHPVWLLMNQIVRAADLWKQPGDSRAARLLACCDSVCAQIAAAPQQSAALYAQGLMRLEAHLDEESRCQLAAAQKAVETLSAAEHRAAIERELSQQLADQSRNVRMSPRIRSFLSQVWVRVVADSMMGLGEDHPTTAAQLKVIDDLLWSLRLPDHPQSRQRLLQILPEMLQRLREGMERVKLAPDEQRAVLDELMAVHTESLRAGAKATVEPTAAEIVQGLRDEGAPGHHPGLGTGFSDSLIDVSSMDTVPAELMPEDDAASPGTPKLNDLLIPGAVWNWYLSGRWRRAQLLWRSGAGRYFLFSGEVEGQTHSITRQALDRLAAEGLLKTVSDAPLIQRAVDRVMAQLAAAP